MVIQKIKEVFIFNLLYKWKYLIAMLKALLLFDDTNTSVKSITYVAREADKSWIFGAKVRRLSKFSRLNARPYFHAKLRNLPKTDAYFFIFPNYFCRAMRHNPFILNKKNIVMYTHQHWTNSYSKTHICWCLNKADKVICLNSTTKKQLIEIGVKPIKIEVIHIASSPNMFYEHERNSGAVGFCCAYSERKNPELIFNIIKNMPEKQFYIIGVLWENFEKFIDLTNLSNFTYINNADYSEYPNLYNKIDTFISASFLEGGPVPLLEAMFSNCFPIASKTGFCEDIIKHGSNGFLFETNARAEEVIQLIKQADNINTNTRESVLPYSWENCSKRIDELFLSI
jgi:glycosyltransferase involved in cell wall biosynthesis